MKCKSNFYPLSPTFLVISLRKEKIRMLYDYIFKNWDPNRKSQVIQNANTTVMCIQVGDSAAEKWKPQSAFLASCPSLNIPFRDNRQQRRHEALSLIHCTGRSELLKHLHGWITLRTLCHSCGMVKRSQVEVTFLVLSPCYCTQLNQASLSFQKLWQRREKCLCITPWQGQSTGLPYWRVFCSPRGRMSQLSCHFAYE